MNSDVKKYQPEDEYYFEEGCFITELSNSEEDPEVSIARARVEPGKTTKWHALEGITERYFILEGEGLAELRAELGAELRAELRAEIGDAEAQTVKEGDTLVIPPLMPQRITNTGAVDLVFLAICSPRFIKSAYRQLEE